MIGLIDCDMLQRGMSFFPTLDLMKLYSYYKAFDSCKLIGPKDDISYYSKLYIWKDLKESYINDRFWGHNNIITGGLYFNNNQHKPFDNIDIENASPSIKLYSDFFKIILSSQNATFKNAVIKYLYSSYIKINTTGKLQVDQVKKDKTLYVYDTDIFQGQTIDILSDFAKRAKSIHYTNYIFVKSYNDLKKIIKNNIYSGSNFKYNNERVIIDFPVKIEDWLSFISEIREFSNSIPEYNIGLKFYDDNSKIAYHSKQWYNNFTKEMIDKWILAYINGIKMYIVVTEDNPYYLLIQTMFYFFTKLNTNSQRSFYQYLHDTDYDQFKILKELYNFDTIYSRNLKLPIKKMKEMYYDKSGRKKRNRIVKK